MVIKYNLQTRGLSSFTEVKQEFGFSPLNFYLNVLKYIFVTMFTIFAFGPFILC